MELLTAFLIGLALMEIYAWLPRVCEWIVGLAIRLLPTGQCERWGEEFQESQSALPQTAWRLVHAISLCCGALSMRRSLAIADAEDQLECVDKEIASVISQYRAAEVNAGRLTSMIATGTATGRSQIVTLQAQVQSRLQPLSSQNAQVVANAAALGELAKSLGKAHDRAVNIYAVQNTTISNVLKDASLLVKRVGRNWKFTRRVWPVARKVPIFGPIVLNRALSVVLRDTERLRSCLESDGLIDKKSLEEAHNISLAIRQAAGSISSVAAKRPPSSPQQPA